MIKVKDGYAKLISTSYKGSGDRVLLSNGGDIGKAVSSTADTLVLRNAKGLIESSVTSTLAPFVISSTKVNTNLNADLLDGFLANDLFQSLTSAVDKNLYIKIGDSEKEIPLLYASYLGGVTKEELFTELTNVNDSTNPNSIKVTIGDTTKYLKVAYSDLAGKVVCSSSTNNVDRPIVVTNKSNEVYYSTKVTLNYSTGNVTAPTFTGDLIGNADTATTASKLSTVSKTAWGLTYWTSGGVPTSISGDMFGVGNISISATGNKDYFINFLYNNTPTYSWRLGYLGSGNANYFVIDSSKSSGGTWHRVLLLGNEDLNATFSGQVIAPNFVSGDGINDFSAGTVKLDVLNIPTSSGGTTFGPGSNGQVLKSNGTTVYWGTDNNSDITITNSGTGNAITGLSASGHAITATKGSFAPTGTVVFTPANGELTPLDVLDITGEWSIRKGSWSYANNGYIAAGDFGNIDLAGTSVLTFGGSTAYTQLYITAPTQSGHSGKTNEIFFYNNHGDSYNPSWTRVITNRNYTDYVNTTNFPGLDKVGTITEVTAGAGLSGGGTSGKVTITNAGVRSVTIGTGNNSNTVAVNTNGTTAYLTIPYATTASLLRNTSVSDPSKAASGLYLKWYSSVGQASGYAGNNYGFPVSNNANGILWLGTHLGPYGWQMGFSSNGRIYARYISNNTFPTTANGGSWNKVAWESDIPTKTSQLTNDSDFITQTAADNRYVNIEGDTMTGLLTLGSNSYEKTIKWANTDYPSASTIAFMGASGDWVVRSTYTSDSSTADLRFNKSTLKINGNIALHTGNSSVSGGGSSVGSSITVNLNGTSKTLTIPATSTNSEYLKVHDIRGTDHLPESTNYPNRYITAWFNSTGTPDNSWYSGLTVRGWTGGYAAWQICSYSSTSTANNYSLYLRNGINDTWGSWKTILDDSNTSASGGGSNWGDSITVSINGVSTTLTIPNLPADVNVTLTNTTTSANYRVLLSKNANDTTETASSRKSAKLYFNPSTGVLTTTKVSANLDGDIVKKTPLLCAATESDNINIVENANGTITNNYISNLSAIRKAILFRWYSTYWQIGNIRGASSGTDGFGITYGSNKLCFRVTEAASYVYGNMYAVHFYESSDKRLKTNIQEILNSDKMPTIKEFDWKEDGSHSYGLIAQELEEQGYSELVSVKDDGYKTVNYSAALSLIVGKLQVKILELEKEIEILKSKN